jgi:hypothetical protein
MVTDADLFDWPLPAADLESLDVEDRLRHDLLDMIRQVKRLQARLDYLEEENRRFKLRPAPPRLVLATDPPGG